AWTALTIQFVEQEGDRLHFQVATEDPAYLDGRFSVDHQLLVDGPVAKRDGTAHPDAFLARGSNLVADALRRNLALKLGKGQEHIQRQPAHRCRGVELLRHRDEGHVVGIEYLHDLGKVHQRTGQAVDLVDDDHVDLSV